MTKPIRNTGPCFHLSLPRQRHVLSHTELINVHILHALLFQTIPFELHREPPTANWWDPALGTPRGDKYYNQYRPQFKVCPRDHCKVEGSLQGVAYDSLASIYNNIMYICALKRHTPLSFI